MLAFEAGFGATETGKQKGGFERGGVVEHACQEGWEGVSGDAEGGGEDVDVHDEFRDKQGGGGAVEAEAPGKDVAENAGDAGSDDVVGGELLVLIDGGDEGRTGGPESVEDD